MYGSVAKATSQVEKFQIFYAALPYAMVSPEFAERPVPADKGKKDSISRGSNRIAEMGRRAVDRVREPSQEPELGFFQRLFNPVEQIPNFKGNTSGRGFQEVIKAANRHGVNVNLALKVAKQESGGTCKITSSANARGVMQVIPKTAAIHGYSGHELYDCAKGADAGVRELKRLLKMYNGNVKKTLIGYNCGPQCNERKRLPQETIHYIKVVGGYK